MLSNLCLLFWHFNSCWNWLSHSLVILGRRLWCDAILYVVVPPYGHNIWYKSCCTFTVMMSGSPGSVSNAPKYLKTMYLLDLRRQMAMLIHEHAWDCTQLIIGARLNCHCWPSVKSTRKILSNSVTCLALMSYCTSWWHSFDRSTYGIIESSDFIVETIFPSHHQCVQSHACSTQKERFDQWLDYKSCWQIYSHMLIFLHLCHNEIVVKYIQDMERFECFFLLHLCGWIFLVNHFSRCQSRLKHTLESSLADSDCSLLPIWSGHSIQMASMASTDKCTGHQVGLPLLHLVGRVSPTYTVLGNESIIPGQ